MDGTSTFVLLSDNNVPERLTKRGDAAGDGMADKNPGLRTEGELFFSFPEVSLHELNSRSKNIHP